MVFVTKHKPDESWPNQRSPSFLAFFPAWDELFWLAHMIVRRNTQPTTIWLEHPFPFWPLRSISEKYSQFNSRKIYLNYFILHEILNNFFHKFDYKLMIGNIQIWLVMQSLLNKAKNHRRIGKSLLSKCCIWINIWVDLNGCINFIKTGKMAKEGQVSKIK